MNTANIKIDLISKISQLQDSDVIKEIKRVLDFELSEGIIKLSDGQKKSIAVAKDEMRQKKTLSESKANKEIDEWLGK